MCQWSMHSLKYVHWHGLPQAYLVERHNGPAKQQSCSNPRIFLRWLSQSLTSASTSTSITALCYTPAFLSPSLHPSIRSIHFALYHQNGIKSLKVRPNLSDTVPIESSKIPLVLISMTYLGNRWPSGGIDSLADNTVLHWSCSWFLLFFFNWLLVKRCTLFECGAYDFGDTGGCKESREVFIRFWRDGYDDQYYDTERKAYTILSAWPMEGCPSLIESVIDPRRNIYALVLEKSGPSLEELCNLMSPVRFDEKMSLALAIQMVRVFFFFPCCSRAAGSYLTFSISLIATLIFTPEK